MTKEQTKKLAIEFERRLQVMYPNSKYTEKLNSDLIYSILNEYQIKYIKQLYAAQRQQKFGEFGAETIDNVLRSLCTTTVHRIDADDMFDIPKDYWMYLRSSSVAFVRYNKGNNEKTTLSNELIEDKDTNSVITKYDNYAGILRHPLLITQGDKFKVLHDLYTTMIGVQLVYYRQPKKFGYCIQEAEGLHFDSVIYHLDGAIGESDPLTITPDRIIYVKDGDQFIACKGEGENEEYYKFWQTEDAEKYMNPSDGEVFICDEDQRKYIYEYNKLVESGSNKNRIINECELPYSAFDDLVNGAIKLYVFEYKFALALSASNSKYNKLKKGVDKLADDNKQEQ